MLPSELRCRGRRRRHRRREDAVRRLHAAEDTVELGPAGGPRGEADVPAPRARAPFSLLLREAAIGLVLGLVLVGLWRLERRYGAAWRPPGDGRRRRGRGRGPAQPRWWAAWGRSGGGQRPGRPPLAHYAVLGPA